MHQNEVHAERFARQLLRFNDLLLQQFRRHRGAGDDTEGARIAEGCDQMTLAHPAHRPAHDGVFAAEQITSTLPEIVQVTQRGHPMK